MIIHFKLHYYNLPNTEIIYSKFRDLRPQLKLCYFLLFVSWDHRDDGYKTVAETCSWFSK